MDVTSHIDRPTGVELRQMRLGRGWSQETAAWHARCSTTRLRQLERGMDFDSPSAVRDRLVEVLRAK